jgi:hypothetical protein
MAKAGKTKGLIRSLNRRGSASSKLKAGEVRTGRPAEPSACQRCGAVFVRRVWRRDAAVSHALLAKARWTVCPACVQARDAEGFGRIVVEGAFVAPNAAAIEARIRNVAARAQHTQPERRAVSFERRDGGLEVLTTSQKLAHRIVHELRKAFRGRASYAWSDDGTLFARWRRDDVRAR